MTDSCGHQMTYKQVSDDMERAHAEHETRQGCNPAVVVAGMFTWAQCGCGWQGPLRQTEQGALTDCDAHAKGERTR